MRKVLFGVVRARPCCFSLQYKTFSAIIMLVSDKKDSGVTEHRANSDHGEIFVENYRKKQLTGKVPYNIITQCDVVRRCLSQ